MIRSLVVGGKDPFPRRLRDPTAARSQWATDWWLSVWKFQFVAAGLDLWLKTRASRSYQGPWGKYLWRMRRL